MKKTFKSLKFPAAFLFVLVGFVACDKEFTELDSAVLGKDNANFDTGLYEIPIVAYNKKLESVQVNNLDSYLLGVFNDPAYGQTTASIVTQVTPFTYDPDFWENTIINSVVITIPYYSRINNYDDVNNSLSTRDYDFDPTESNTDPFNSKLISLGQRVIDENDNYKYKIRLTEHLNNILVNDSTNTKIGLVLSTNVNYTTNAKVADSDGDDVTNIPAASVITRRGTILYGSNENVDQEKKIKFKVFYTEPK